MQFNDDEALSAFVNMSSSVLTNHRFAVPPNGCARVERLCVLSTVKHGSDFLLYSLSFSSQSDFPTAARYLWGRLCASRHLCASRRGTVKYVGIPEWRMGRSATQGSCTSTMTPAAHLTANSKSVRSAGTNFNS